MALVTLTAPGRVAHRRREPWHPPMRAGAVGEWVDCECSAGMHRPDALAVWNAGLGKRWNRLLDHGVKRQPATFGWLLQARTLSGAPTLSYLKATEAQRRGALHVHALVQVEDGMTLPTCAPGCEARGCKACADARAADPRVAELGRLAEEYGFGHVLDVQVLAGNRAAGYVAKYVSKGTNDRPDVPWMREHTEDEPRHWHARVVRRVGLGSIRGRATYRAWTASRSWPNTMRALREAQRHYATLLPLVPPWVLADGTAQDTGPWAGRDWSAAPARPVDGSRSPDEGADGVAARLPVDRLASAVERVLEARAGLVLPRALAALEAGGVAVLGASSWQAREAGRAVEYPRGLRVSLL